MAHWFHRNPLKATSEVKFDLKMVASDASSLKICSDLKQARLRFLELTPNPNHEIDTYEPALALYLSLLRGLVLPPEDESSDWSKLRHNIRFRWTHSVLGTIPEAQNDALFELVSILQNAAFWYLKHAAKVAAQDDVTMDDSKEVHRSLRRGAGILKHCQEEWVHKLVESSATGGDSDPRVYTAYVNQTTAEAQEVTIARAIELKHNASLVSALAFETSKMFTTAADSIESLDEVKFGHWKRYLRLKSCFYMAYAYNYSGENLLGQDKCGEAIRSLQEAKKYYLEAENLCKEYAKIKGPGTRAKPDRHHFFRRLLPIVNRTLEKCERENGMIYHQKVPFDAPALELKATYGLVSPDDYTLPPLAPIWSAVTYASFDLTKNLPAKSAEKSDETQKNDKEEKKDKQGKKEKPEEKDKQKNKEKQEDKEKKQEPELPPVKEVKIHQKGEDHNNDSGCSVM